MNEYPFIDFPEPREKIGFFIDMVLIEFSEITPICVIAYCCYQYEIKAKMENISNIQNCNENIRDDCEFINILYVP